VIAAGTAVGAKAADWAPPESDNAAEATGVREVASSSHAMGGEAAAEVAAQPEMLRRFASIETTMQRLTLEMSAKAEAAEAARVKAAADLARAEARAEEKVRGASQGMRRASEASEP